MAHVSNLAKVSYWGARALALAFLAQAARPSLAAETSTWSGGASGIWGLGYEANWDTYPDSTRYARFASPADALITVQVNGNVEAYGIENSSSRKAGINFTGTGTISNYRATLFADNGTFSMTDWDVDVVNTGSSAGTTLNIRGTNVFHKTLDCSGAYTFSVKENTKVTLCDSAQMSAQHVTVPTGSAFELTGSSVATLTKDLKNDPGASFRITTNAVLNVRRLYLPFSKEEWVNDEWVMEGGEVRAADTTSNSCVEMPYTNATKTISGTGTFRTYRFYFINASNLVLRLNGPNLYARDSYFSSSSPGFNTVFFEFGGGSTIGTYAGDASFSSCSNRIVGAATIDTTDYDDKTTPRVITMNRIDKCNGDLTVKGVGTFTFNESVIQPDLNVTVRDNATLTLVSWGNVYVLGDLVLEDAAILDAPNYLGHHNAAEYIKSITMSNNTTLAVQRYVQASGDVSLSGNASAVIRNANNESGATLACANLSLSDDASLSVTGTIAATSLSMSGNAHLAFTANTPFAAGAPFGPGNWTMEITVPSGYEAGIRPVVMGAGFTGDFADHVTLLGETAGWSVRTLDGNLVLYKELPPSGVEWIGKSASSDNWSETANWNGGVLPTAEDIVAFGGLDRPTPYDNTLGTVSGLVFRASAGPFVLSGSGDLTTTAECGSGRGSATADNASIVSHSAFDQTVEPFVDLGNNNVFLLSDGGGALKLTGGLRASNNWRYLVVGGDVQVNGTCSVGIFSFKTSTTMRPSCLRILPGGDFTVRNQSFHSLAESTTYIGRIVVEAGGQMTILDGDCSFLYGGLENVINGTLVIKAGTADTGRLIAGPTEQYYVGSGSIYADSARSARYNPTTRRLNFGGTLKLCMNGHWYTATYRDEGGSTGVVQNPNYPTRFRMTDGTTLGATKDWTYGPRDTAYDVIADALTPADRTSIMVGTVTVNTQSPKDGSAHTITFVDPLDASAANVVKAGDGSLVFNPTTTYPSQLGNLTVNAGTVLFDGAATPIVGAATVNAGTVRFAVDPALGDLTIAAGATASFAAVPTLTGTLTISSPESEFAVDGVSTAPGWNLLATAADVVTPNGAATWHSADGKQVFQVVADGAAKSLFGYVARGTIMIFR